MDEERTKILEMLSEGKITAEEAEQLLKALRGKQPSQAEAQEIQGRGRWLDWIVSLFGAKAKYMEQLDWTLEGVGVSSIKAQTANGSISLRGSDQDQVTVSAWKKIQAPTEAAAEEFARQVQIHVERHGDEIRIHPIGYSVSVRYEISSPRSVDANLRTSNGAIHVDQVDGAVEAVTSNGAIELQGGAGNVNLCTSNGAIQLQDAMGHVRVETSNGKIKASVGQLKEGVFSTSNGSINVKVREGNAPVTAKTSNGSIHLALPADFDGQLDARTSHGRVHSELPVSTTEGTRNRLVGQIGEGGETMVKLRTLNGSIHLRAQG
jgi:DUF4097 and DUF4098 domain-containing protein YvlB